MQLIERAAFIAGFDLKNRHSPVIAMAESQSAFEPSHVGIIGAGVSGLRCASILLEQGFRVTILEARDRIGGRVGYMTPFVFLSRLDQVADPASDLPVR